MPLRAMGFGLGGKRLWALGHGFALRQWDTTTAKELEDPIVWPAFPGDAVVSPNGMYVANEPRGKDGQIVSTATGRKVGEIKAIAATALTSLVGMAFSPDSTLLGLRREREQKLDLLEVPSAKLRHSLDIVGLAARPGGLSVRNINMASIILFSPDGRLLAAYSDFGVVSIWDTAPGMKRTSLNLQAGPTVVGGAFLPDGYCLALDMNDGSVVLWELATGKERRVLGTKVELPKGPKGTRLALNGPAKGPRTPIALSPTGNLLVHAGADRAVHVWDVRTGEEVATFHGHAGNINAVAFAAEGKTIASASDDTTVLLWDLSAAAAKAPVVRALSANELETRWATLKSDDASTAFSALCELSAAPTEAVAFLKDRLTPAPPLDMKLVEKLIAELDDASYKVRQKANIELVKMGERVMPVIDKVLTGNLPLEPKKRLEDMRERLSQTVLREESLRGYRAIEALERIGTPQAREVLQVLAHGAPGALSTNAAQAALARLEQ
jgi:hypothetical protein